MSNPRKKNPLTRTTVTNHQNNSNNNNQKHTVNHQNANLQNKNNSQFVGILTVGIVSLLALVVLLCVWNFLAAFATLRTVDTEQVTSSSSIRNGGREEPNPGKQMHDEDLSPIPFHRLTARNYQPFSTPKEQDSYFIYQNQNHLYPQPQPETQLFHIDENPRIERDTKVQALLGAGMHSFSGSFVF